MARACHEPFEMVSDNIAESHAKDLKDAASYKLAFKALVRRMLKKTRLYFIAKFVFVKKE